MEIMNNNEECYTGEQSTGSIDQQQLRDEGGGTMSSNTSGIKGNHRIKEYGIDNNSTNEIIDTVIHIEQEGAESDGVRLSSFSIPDDLKSRSLRQQQQGYDGDDGIYQLSADSSIVSQSVDTSVVMSREEVSSSFVVTEKNNENDNSIRCADTDPVHTVVLTSDNDALSSEKFKNAVESNQRQSCTDKNNSHNQKNAEGTNTESSPNDHPNQPSTISDVQSHVSVQQIDPPESDYSRPHVMIPPSVVHIQRDQQQQQLQNDRNGSFHSQVATPIASNGHQRSLTPSAQPIATLPELSLLKDALPQISRASSAEQQQQPQVLFQTPDRKQQLNDPFATQAVPQHLTVIPSPSHQITAPSSQASPHQTNQSLTIPFHQQQVPESAIQQQQFHVNSSGQRQQPQQLGIETKPRKSRFVLLNQNPVVSSSMQLPGNDGGNQQIMHQLNIQEQQHSPPHMRQEEYQHQSAGFSHQTLQLQDQAQYQMTSTTSNQSLPQLNQAHNLGLGLQRPASPQLPRNASDQHNMIHRRATSECIPSVRLARTNSGGRSGNGLVYFQPSQGRQSRQNSGIPDLGQIYAEPVPTQSPGVAGDHQKPPRPVSVPHPHSDGYLVNAQSSMHATFAQSHQSPTDQGNISRNHSSSDTSHAVGNQNTIPTPHGGNAVSAPNQVGTSAGQVAQIQNSHLEIPQLGQEKAHQQVASEAAANSTAAPPRPGNVGGMVGNTVVVRIGTDAAVVRKKKGRFNFLEGAPVPSTASASTNPEEHTDSTTTGTTRNNGIVPSGAASLGQNSQGQPVVKKKGRFVVTSTEPGAGAQITNVQPVSGQVVNLQPVAAQATNLQPGPVAVGAVLSQSQIPGTEQQTVSSRTNMNMFPAEAIQSVGSRTDNMMGPPANHHVAYGTLPSGPATGVVSQVIGVGDPLAVNTVQQVPSGNPTPPRSNSTPVTSNAYQNVPVSETSVTDGGSQPPQSLIPTQQIRSAKEDGGTKVKGPTVEATTSNKSSSLSASIPQSPRLPPAVTISSYAARSTKSAHGGQQGLGKLMYFVDQMRLELSEVDRTSKSQQTEMKCLKEKNKELEAKIRDLERKLNSEKALREKSEAKVKDLKAKVRALKEGAAAVEADPVKEDLTAAGVMRVGKVSRSNSYDGEMEKEGATRHGVPTEASSGTNKISPLSNMVDISDHDECVFSTPSARKAMVTEITHSSPTIEHNKNLHVPRPPTLPTFQKMSTSTAGANVSGGANRLNLNLDSCSTTRNQTVTSSPEQATQKHIEISQLPIISCSANTIDSTKSRGHISPPSNKIKGAKKPIALNALDASKIDMQHEIIQSGTVTPINPFGPLPVRPASACSKSRSGSLSSMAVASSRRPGSSLTRNFDPLAPTSSGSQDNSPADGSQSTDADTTMTHHYSTIPVILVNQDKLEPMERIAIDSSDLISFQGDPVVSSTPQPSEFGQSFSSGMDQYSSNNPQNPGLFRDRQQQPMFLIQHPVPMSAWPHSQPLMKATSGMNDVPIMTYTQPFPPSYQQQIESDVGNSRNHSRNPSIVHLSHGNQSWSSSPSHQGSISYSQPDLLSSSDVGSTGTDITTNDLLFSSLDGKPSILLPQPVVPSHAQTASSSSDDLLSSSDPFDDIAQRRVSLNPSSTSHPNML